MRLFIAVSIPDEIRQQVAALQKRLRTLPVDVRWVEEEKFHLTLKFLGEVSDEKVAAVTAAAAAAVRGCAPFNVALTGMGAFPPGRSPRVLWLGIRDGKEPLQELARRIDEALAALGFEREKRAFSGHLTLGRVRSPQNSGLLTKRIAALNETPMGIFCVRGIEVMRSILHPQGSHYQCLKSLSM